MTPNARRHIEKRRDSIWRHLSELLFAIHLKHEFLACGTESNVPARMRVLLRTIETAAVEDEAPVLRQCLQTVSICLLRAERTTRAIRVFQFLVSFSVEESRFHLFLDAVLRIPVLDLLQLPTVRDLVAVRV